MDSKLNFHNQVSEIRRNCHPPVCLAAFVDIQYLLFTEWNHGITSRSFSYLFHSYWCYLKPVISVQATIQFSRLRRVGVM